MSGLETKFEKIMKEQVADYTKEEFDKLISEMKLRKEQKEIAKQEEEARNKKAETWAVTAAGAAEGAAAGASIDVKMGEGSEEEEG